jgi:hypothetical protein
VWSRYCACEILIANPIDCIYAAFLKYFIFFSIDSSEARKQYDEHCNKMYTSVKYINSVVITDRERDVEV